MASVTILIPTRNRPDPLARALASIDRQVLPAGIAADILVVDNSADGNAAPVIAAPRKMPIRGLHEPRPGVSTARNCGVAAAAGEIVAFLDDDCEAAPGWLAAQLATLARTGADASFGPRLATVDGPAGASAAFIVDTYTRDLKLPNGADVTRRDAHLPLPGAAFVKARCLAGAPFDQRLDSIGGEDVLLFRRLRIAGRRFVWSPAATVVETIPSERVDAGFIMQRRYLSGQHRCLIPMLIDPPARAEMLAHMLKGAAAVAVAAPLALAGRLRGAWPVGPTGLMMSGLGKLTWWRREKPRLYGSSHR